MTILCVTPSPAIDRTARVERIEHDRVLRPTELSVLAGGKGVNVARAAHGLGALVATTGFAGGHAGCWLLEALATEGLNPRFVTTPAETRTTYVIVDARGRTVLVYEPAPALETGDLDRLAALLASELLPAASFVVIAGSLPHGTDPAAAGRLVRLCHEADRPCLVDLTGPDLHAALEARPSLAKISLDEAIDAGMVRGPGPRAAADAAVELVRRGASRAIVTDGARGAAGFDGATVCEAAAPAVTAVSAVGSGDALSAGVAIALTGGRSFADALAMGVAAGTANARSLGAGRLEPDGLEQTLAGVRVRTLPSATTGGRRRGAA
jgi:1-phosphofructokinase family hexose kinase